MQLSSFGATLATNPYAQLSQPAAVQLQQQTASVSEVEQDVEYPITTMVTQPQQPVAQQQQQQSGDNHFKDDQANTSLNSTIETQTVITCLPGQHKIFYYFFRDSGLEYFC